MGTAFLRLYLRRKEISCLESAEEEEEEEAAPSLSLPLFPAASEDAGEEPNDKDGAQPKRPKVHFEDVAKDQELMSARRTRVMTRGPAGAGGASRSRGGLVRARGQGAGDAWRCPSARPAPLRTQPPGRLAPRLAAL